MKIKKNWWWEFLYFIRYLFTFSTIVILLLKRKKKYIYIYIHPHKQTKKPCFLCQNSTLVIDWWKRAINSDFVLFVVTYGDYKDLSNSMLYKGFGYRTLLNLYRSDINNLVPVYFTHTHTHIYIYIYIYGIQLLISSCCLIYSCKFGFFLL